MSYEEKIERVRSMLHEHNEVLGENGPHAKQEANIHKIDVDATIQLIKASGGTNEDRLKRFSFEEVEQNIVMCEGGQKLLKFTILAKDIAEIFRSGSSEQTEVKSISTKRAKDLTNRQLVELYQPDQSENSVGTRLRELSKGKAFIVFESGRKVDVETSLKLLMELLQGYEPRTTIKVGSDFKEVHPIGFVPENYADENPIYHNRPLRPDGTCDQTNRSWEGVSKKLRQLVYLSVKGKQVTINDAHNILDLILSEDGERKFIDRNADALLAWKRLDETQNLPSLKISLCKSNSPLGAFSKGKQVQWVLAPAKNGLNVYRHN